MNNPLFHVFPMLHPPTSLRCLRRAAGAFVLLAYVGAGLPGALAQATPKQTPPPAKPDSQPSTQPPTQPAPQPTTPPSQARPKFKSSPGDVVVPNAPNDPSMDNPADLQGVGDVPLGPYVSRAEHRDMLVNIEIQLFSDNNEMKETIRDPQSGKTVDMPKITPFEIKTLRMLFPMLKRTAGSDLLGQVEKWEEVAGGNLGFRGRMLVAERLEDFEPEPLAKDDLATYAAWDFNPPDASNAREVVLKVQFPVRAYATAFDEDAAMKVAWPASWPKDAQDAMKPQLYIEQGIKVENDRRSIENYDRKPLTDAVKAMLANEGITDPKATTPVRVAKAITGQLWRNINISGDGVERRRRTGEFMGLTIQAPASTMREGRGSPHDIVALLVALLREAGIPARPVIGVDIGGKDDKFLSSASDKKKLHSWVEFYLFDEPKNAHNWVPIDIAKMRLASPRPPKFDAPWRGFGTVPSLDAVAPFAVAFHPPQQGVAAYGAAGFWGWFVTPANPARAEQVIAFSIDSVPRRAGGDLQPMSQPRDTRPTDKRRDGRDRNR